MGDRHSAPSLALTPACAHRAPRPRDPPATRLGCTLGHSSPGCGCSRRDRGCGWQTPGSPGRWAQTGHSTSLHLRNARVPEEPGLGLSAPAAGSGKTHWLMPPGAGLRSIAKRTLPELTSDSLSARLQPQNCRLQTQVPNSAAHPNRVPDPTSSPPAILPAPRPPRSTRLPACTLRPPGHAVPCTTPSSAGSAWRHCPWYLPILLCKAGPARSGCALWPDHGHS